ncbi:MAG: hypothetical protein ACLPUG_01035 [Acidimicrobiales bacterium]
MVADTLVTSELTPVARAPRPRRFTTLEIAVAVGAFALFCVAVLTKATKLLEPDDSAYLASIIALTHGHITLSSAQYSALMASLSAHGGPGIMQWIQLSDGRWMSEKNPGYPFFAAPFQMLGILRAAPLFAGALASTSLFAAGRRWLGSWGGTWAVVLFVSSGAAISFAWRPTMPSFTDAALVAAGAGTLLWTFLADDASPRRRTVVGLLGFVSLEMAVFIRYTDVVMLVVAVPAVLLTFRKARIPARSLSWWLGSVALFAGGVMVFDEAFYGGALKTGYGAGEITFALRAIVPNLKIMPPNLLKAMPALLLGLAALLWMVVRVVRSRSFGADPVSASKIRRDAVIGLVLASGWLGLWGLYSAYTWTAGTGSAGGLPGGGDGGGIHVIRFYLPAIGLIALLGAWLLMQLPKWVPVAVLLVVAVGGFASFRNLTAVDAVGPGARGGLPGGPPGQTKGVRLPVPASGVAVPNGYHPVPAGSPPGRKPPNRRPPAGLSAPGGVTPGRRPPPLQ